MFQFSDVLFLIKMKKANSLKRCGIKKGDYGGLWPGNRNI
jgi:hypothetical protein